MRPLSTTTLIKNINTIRLLNRTQRCATAIVVLPFAAYLMQLEPHVHSRYPTHWSLHPGVRFRIPEKSTGYSDALFLTAGEHGAFEPTTVEKRQEDMMKS